MSKYRLLNRVFPRQRIKYFAITKDIFRLLI